MRKQAIEFLVYGDLGTEAFCFRFSTCARQCGRAIATEVRRQYPDFDGMANYDFVVGGESRTGSVDVGYYTD